jgi:SET domain-containing protein
MQPVCQMRRRIHVRDSSEPLRHGYPMQPVCQMRRRIHVRDSSEPLRHGYPMQPANSGKSGN